MPGEEVNVVSPFPCVAPPLSVDFGAEAELVSVAVFLSRLAVVERDGFDAERRQRVQFAGFGDGVVVRVSPRPRAAEDLAASADRAVAVAAVRRRVITSEGAEAVPLH